MLLAGCPLASETMGTSQRGNEIAVDSSGHGRHGIYVGAVTLGRPSLLSGDPNTCVRFNTVDDFVFIGDHTAFSFTTNSFAFEFWYQPQYTSFYEGLFGKRSESAWEYAVYREGAALQFRTFDAGGTAVYSTSYTLLDLAAHYYVWVADGANAVLYVDAVNTNTVAKSGASMANTTAPLILGQPGPVTDSPLVFVFVHEAIVGLTEVNNVDQSGSTTVTASDTLGRLAETATLVISGPVELTVSDEVGHLEDQSEVVATPSDIVAVTASDSLSVGVFEPYYYENAISTPDALGMGLDELTGYEDELRIGLTETASLTLSEPTNIVASDSLHLGLDELTSYTDSLMGFGESAAVNIFTP
jgi:hypothetical protein